jgi:hypothetical protein
MSDEDNDVLMEDETEQEIHPDIRKLSDRDLKMELSLPEVLVSLSRNDKLQLLMFKRTHTEIDWEEELLRRQELIARKIDLERLKRMTGKDKTTKAKGRKAKTVQESDDDLSDLGDIGSIGSGDSDDDLFDSDEEREILAKKAKKTVSKKGQKTVNKKGKDGDESDDGLGEDQDHLEDDDAKLDIEAEAANKVDTSAPAELIDYWRIQTRRRFIESILKEPYFKTALEGTFVRIVVGALDNGEKVYRMCEIKDVTSNANKVYLPDSKQYTTMRLTVAIGPKEKSRIKFTDVSNRRISQIELTQYLEALEGTRESKPLTKDQVKYVKSRRDKIVANYKYTKEEIDAMIERRSGQSKAAHTSHKDALENLEHQIKLATTESRLDDLEKLSREREVLQQNLADLQAKMGKRHEAHGLLNKKNYERNFAKDMFASKQNKMKALQNNTDDPFARRETVPENLWSASTRNKNSNASKTRVEENAKTASATPSVPSDAPAISQMKQHAPEVLLDNIGMDMKSIRSRVKRRLGVDPIEAASVDPVARYLKRVCQSFPQKGTDAREAARDGMSLSAYQAITASV